MSEKILEKAREVKLVLFGRKRIEERLLQELEDSLVRVEVTKQEAGKENPEALHHAALQLIEMLPKTHYGA